MRFGRQPRHCTLPSIFSNLNNDERYYDKSISLIESELSYYSNRLENLTFWTGIASLGWFCNAIIKKYVDSEYDANFDAISGQLYKIEDAQGDALWETIEKNAMGQVTRFATGNGVQSRRGHNPATGRLQGIYSWKNHNILQNMSYEYDDFGNLAVRYNKMRGLRETFGYDELDRLDNIWLNGAHTGVMAYDALGRMTSKHTDGQTVFFSAQHDYVGPDGQLRPHAISSAQVQDIPIPTGQLDIDYTMFDKVSSIRYSAGGATSTFLYGYDHQRIACSAMSVLETKTKFYVGNCEFVSEYAKSDRSFTYLSGPLGVFAVVEKENGVESIHYVLKDHLGSWTTITDAIGNIEQESSFDAWGNTRNPETWTGTVAQQPMFDRGYTGHEHLNSFGLINMNGRMYDPVMSSFLSVDNYVQRPDFSQNFNRYAYCMNNPLKYTDPSGEVFGIDDVLVAMAVSAVLNVTINGINNVKYGENFFLGAGKAAVVGAVQGLFSYGIGECAGAMDILFKSATVAKFAKAGFQLVAHGTVGGISTESRGGNFWHGFASSATASLISGAVGLTCAHYEVSEGWTRLAMVAAGGLSGGVSASMAGGDFWDGVCNGLICVGLNHALHYVVKPIGPEDPPKGAKVHSGKNLLAKCYWHYQFGGGKDYWVDASTLDLDYISFDNLNDNPDGTYWVNLFDYSKTAQSALALGKITLNPVGDNQYEISFDIYDFNMEWNQGMTSRNIGTAISGFLHGPVIDNNPIPTHWMGGRPCYAQPSVYFGGPFEIHFSKTVYIKP